MVIEGIKAEIHISQGPHIADGLPLVLSAKDLSFPGVSEIVSRPIADLSAVELVLLQLQTTPIRLALADNTIINVFWWQFSRDQESNHSFRFLPQEGGIENLAFQPHLIGDLRITGVQLRRNLNVASETLSSKSTDSGKLPISGDLLKHLRVDMNTGNTIVYVAGDRFEFIPKPLSQVEIKELNDLSLISPGDKWEMDIFAWD